MVATILDIYPTDETIDVDVRITDDSGNYLSRHNLNFNNGENITEKDIERAVNNLLDNLAKPPEEVIL